MKSVKEDNPPLRIYFEQKVYLLDNSVYFILLMQYTWRDRQQ